MIYRFIGDLKVKFYSIGIYVFFMALAAVLGLGKGIVFAKLLGEEGLGYYTMMNLVAAYGVYVCSLGILDGLLCELSIMRGRGEIEEAYSIRDVSSGGLFVISSTLLSLYLITVLILFKSTSSYFFTLVASGFLSVSMTYFNFGMLELRTTNRPLNYSIAMVLKNGMVLLVAIPVSFYSGFKGILISECVVTALLFLAIRHFWIDKFKMSFKNISKVVKVARVGLPLMFGAILRNLASNMDRWFVVFIFSISDFGQYSFALLVAASGMVILNIINTYFGPKLLYEFGNSPDLLILKKKIWKLSICICVLFCIGWFPLLFVLTYFQSTYFTEYALGFTMMKVIYFGAMFQAMNQFDWLFIAMKKNSVVMYISLCITIVSLVACLIMWALSVGIMHYAFVFTFGRLLHWSLSAYLSDRIVTRCLKLETC